MKTTRNLVAAFLILAIALPTFAQVEYDDMYFNAKDRVKLKAQKAEETSYSHYSVPEKINSEERGQQPGNSNPTDSYSARRINPEYISRSNSEQATEDETNYYVEGYTSATTPTYYGGQAAANNNNFYNNAGWYGPSTVSSWYSPYSSWYSPYYGFNDSWRNSYYGSPYYGGSRFSMSFSYGWGNPWYSGWNNYGWYNPWNNFYDPYYGYGGWNNWYGSPVIIVERGARPTYGKHTTRGGNLASQYNPNARNTGTNTGRSRDTGGRVASNNSQDDYYNPRRRTAAQTYPSRSSSESSSSGRTSSVFPSRSSDPYSSPSRSSSSSGSYQPSRSSSTPSAPRSSGSSGSRSSGSSTGRTRGGN